MHMCCAVLCRAVPCCAVLRRAVPCCADVRSNIESYVWPFFICLGTVRCKTLFIMPFAPYMLTDNVVRANWHQLDQIAVIGNALRWCCDPGAVAREKFCAEDDTSTSNRNRNCNDDDRGITIGSGGVGGGRLLEKKRGSAAATMLHTRTRSRAPCIEMALELGAVLDEVDLWQGNMYTWISPRRGNEAAREKATRVKEVQEATVAAGQIRRQAEAEAGADAEAGYQALGDGETWSRYSLDATLATFKTKVEMLAPERWPSQPPPPPPSAPAPSARSKL